MFLRSFRGFAVSWFVRAMRDQAASGSGMVESTGVKEQDLGREIRVQRIM